MIRISVNIVNLPTLDPNKQYARVLHDYELERYKYKSRLETPPWSLPPLPDNPNADQGVPETCKLYDSRRVRLTKKLQEFWFGLLLKYNPDMTLQAAKRDWASLTDGHRFITNGQGWNEGYADYINNVNTETDGMGYEPLITGGNIVEILGPAENKPGGLRWFPIKCIDPPSNLDVSIINLEKTPELIYNATVIRREVYVGKTRVVDPFSQFNDNSLVPLFSPNGVNFIETTRVAFLPRGSVKPSPYNPPR